MRLNNLIADIKLMEQKMASFKNSFIYLDLLGSAKSINYKNNGYHWLLTFTCQ